jgi:DNA-damage-inducible protein J
MRGVVFMAQAMINFRMDENLKKGMEEACKEMGLSMTAAFTIFATKVSKEKRIPFEVAVNPFYSEANMARLNKAVTDIKAGRMTEHELIEVDDEETVAR